MGISINTLASNTSHSALARRNGATNLNEEDMTSYRQHFNWLYANPSDYMHYLHEIDHG